LGFLWCLTPALKVRGVAIQTGVVGVRRLWRAFLDEGADAFFGIAGKALRPAGSFRVRS
jgi:hypothetical protein